MANVKTRKIRVLFSVEVTIPVNNPNGLDQGPGPMIFGFIQETVDNCLSDIPGLLNVPWADSVGDFKLHGVQEKSNMPAKVCKFVDLEVMP